MLLECALGDALGATYEFASEHFIASHRDNFFHYHGNPKHVNLLPGKYTDDTQMSIAIVLCMLEDNLTKINITQKFIDQFFLDMRPGYAGSFYQFLQSVKDAKDFLKRIRPNSTKSGAAMRASPLGLLPSLSLVKEATIEQARITHNTHEGMNSALLVSLTSHYFYHLNGSKKELGKFLSQQCEYGWRGVQQLKARHIGGGYGCVQAALNAIIKNDNYQQIASDIINQAGDTDTALAIAFSLASVCPEIKNNLPQNLYDDMENKDYGKNYLIELSEQLYKKFPRPQFFKNKPRQAII